MQITTGNLFAFFGANHRSRRIFGLPASDLFRIFHVRKIDHAHRAGGIVSQVNVMFVDKRAMHAPGDGCGVFRNQFRMRRIGRVVERDAVLAVRRALARDNQNLAVGSRADVIHQTGVDFHGVG